MGQDIFLPDMLACESHLKVSSPQLTFSDTKHFISYLQNFLFDTVEDLSDYLHGLTAQLFTNDQQTGCPVNLLSDCLYIPVSGLLFGYLTD